MGIKPVLWGAILLAGVTIAALSYGDYTVTLDPALDYYEGSNVKPIPQAYQGTPTANTLRDLLIAVGIMSAAPAVTQVIFQDRPSVNIVFQGRANAVFQDRMF